MKCIRLEHTNVIEHIRADYLRTLVASMYGMWESAVIVHATFWEIQDEEQRAGHFCTGSDNDLLRFHLLTQLKKHCYEVGWKPICSCAADNHASKKAIEKAGFVSEQRMVKVLFSK